MKKLIQLIAIILLSITGKAQTQFINDPSFEQSGAGANIWMDSSTAGGYLIDNTNGAHTGAYSVDFYVIPNLLYESYCEQVFVNITEQYNCKLEFYIKCYAASGSSTDLLFIQYHNSNYGSKLVYSISGLKSDSASIGNGWKKITVNIDTIFSGFNTIKLLSGSLGIPANINHYGIDDLTITSGFPTNTNEISKESDIININPTLVQNEIHLELINENLQNYKAIIYNFMGQAIQQNNLLNQTHQTISCAHLLQGNYIIVCVNNRGEIVKKASFLKI